MVHTQSPGGDSSHNGNSDIALIPKTSPEPQIPELCHTIQNPEPAKSNHKSIEPLTLCSELSHDPKPRPEEPRH